MPYILFSPVGGTDPISNCRDGSMLHICRKYRPERVVLYFSKEMLMYYNQKVSDRYGEEYGDRYSYCIKRLAEEQSFSTEICVIRCPDLTDVHIFDPFLDEFRKILLGLHQDFPDHTIILNVSSGTPAMKSALNLLAVFLPFQVMSVQVATPEGKQNPRLDTHQLEYDVEKYWKNNKDNAGADFKDRCLEVKNKNLNAQLQKENISTLLKNYDYVAALSVAQKIRPLLPDHAYDLLQAAKSRIELDWDAIKPEIKKELGLSGSNKRRINLAEYLLWLQMKQKRGDLADFLRGITPALFALLQFGVEKEEQYRLTDYCDKPYPDKPYSVMLNPKELQKDERGRELADILSSQRIRLEDSSYLSSRHYCAIIEARLDRKPWAEPLRQLRKVEKKIRNMVAHTITKATEKDIKASKLPVKNSKDIMELLKTAFDMLNKESPLQWDAYEKMNDSIRAILGVKDADAKPDGGKTS